MQLIQMCILWGIVLNRKLEFGKENDLSNAKDRIKFYEKKFVPYYNKLKKGEISTIMKIIRNTGGTH
ncbi:hypothetical protein MNBD_GAMMA11-837 [hydrothermal vent metagenome]|uniref:Uncharacterized protein n=1 Tax=hydrothermal vent metagenome TaxID=652676 RepID=A0A3B0XPC1_9ZZZZ